MFVGKIRIVTLEASIIRIIKFSRIELYLPLSNDVILCQRNYYIPNFKFLASPPSQLLPSLTIKGNLGNANRFKLLHTPQLVISS